jgi:hypothetical protein
VENSPDADSPSDQAVAGEYVSAWGWGHSMGLAAIAHYLFYAADPAGWSGQLINLYA